MKWWHTATRLDLTLKTPHALLLAFLVLIAGTAHGNRQLAVRNGCMSCHADTELDAPPWPELATQYEKYRGQPDAASIQGEKLRQGKFFKNVKAHRKLSPTNAAEIIQWIIDGAN